MESKNTTNKTKKSKNQKPQKTPQTRTPSSPLSPDRNSSTKLSRKRPSFLDLSNLSNARILQTTLVYIINISPSVADENLLKSYEYFGQYGNIQKCVVNKNTVYTNSKEGPAYSAHLTYETEEQAALAIKACEGFILGGRSLKPSFGTTKYCHYFLKDNACPKQDCLFLHHFAPENRVYNRDTVSKTNNITIGQAILDSMKVVVEEPNGTVLPKAHIVRKRVYSEQINLLPKQVTRDRLYSRDLYPFSSRFGFDEPTEEEEPEVSPTLRKLSLTISPCKDKASVPKEFIDEIMSPTSPDKCWVEDVLEIGSDQDPCDSNYVLVSEKKSPVLPVND